MAFRASDSELCTKDVLLDFHRPMLPRALPPLTRIPDPPLFLDGFF